MLVTESEIVTYLRQEFSPELILLGGSRATGQERPDSDWDLYLVGDYLIENERVFHNLRGAHLDIALFPKHLLGDNILRIYYGPLKMLRPLLDNSAGEAALITNATHAAYQHGPGFPPDERKAELVEDIERILSKIVGYAHEPTIAHFHMASLYKLIVPAWFELRGKWSVPVQEAIPIIREESPDFSDLLHHFCTGTIAERVQTSAAIVQQLFGQARHPS